MVRVNPGYSIYKGIKWTGIQQWVLFFIQALTTIILSNILIPDDFGIFISASIPIGLMIIVQEMGIGSVIIRKKNLTNAQIASSFTFLISIALSRNFFAWPKFLICADNEPKR